MKRNKMKRALDGLTKTGLAPGESHQVDHGPPSEKAGFPWVIFFSFRQGFLVDIIKSLIPVGDESPRQLT